MIMNQATELLIPSWVIGMTSKLEPGAQLCTRDGRKIGNAVITHAQEELGSRLLWTILTDAGNQNRFTTEELKELFYTPRLLMDPATAPGQFTPVTQFLPPEETPVLLIRRGKLVIGERRWEYPTYEESFTPYWYWSCPDENWIDDSGEATVTHWKIAPELLIATNDNKN